MAKDKSEKKKKHTSEATPAVVDEDVEMEEKDVSDQYHLGQQSNTRTQKTVKSPKKERDEIIIPLEDLSPIAHPLAQKKLLKKLQKTIKRGASPQRLFIAKVSHHPS